MAGRSDHQLVDPAELAVAVSSVPTASSTQARQTRPHLYTPQLKSGLRIGPRTANSTPTSIGQRAPGSQIRRGGLAPRLAAATFRELLRSQSVLLPATPISWVATVISSPTLTSVTTCRRGHVVFSNNAALGGHVEISRWPPGEIGAHAPAGLHQDRSGCSLPPWCIN